MIYAIVDRNTNEVIGCDVGTPEHHIHKNHPKNSFAIPINEINRPIKVGWYWDNNKKEFIEERGVDNE